jgi:hypothetical protein
MRIKKKRGKMITFKEFKNWHTANGNDTVSQETLKIAYAVYKEMVENYGEDYADDKICGSGAWNESH